MGVEDEGSVKNRHGHLRNTLDNKYFAWFGGAIKPVTLNIVLIQRPDPVCLSVLRGKCVSGGLQARSRHS